MNNETLDRAMHSALLLQLFGKQLNQEMVWFTPPDGSPGYEIPSTVSTQSPLWNAVRDVIEARKPEILARANDEWDNHIDTAMEAVDEILVRQIEATIEEMFDRKLSQWGDKERVVLREIIEQATERKVEERLAEMDLYSVVADAVEAIDLNGVTIDVKLPSREVEKT